MKGFHSVSLLALASLSTSLAVPGTANAAIFTVGGQQYDATSFTGSNSDNSALFNTPSAGGAMPWWGDAAFATAFANAVGSGLGYPNGVAGPYFAFSIDDYGFYFEVNGVSYLGASVSNSFTDSNYTATYALATLIPPSATPTPGPLPILGAASAFGMSRRLRRRIGSQEFKL
ncbi:MAG: hypothetical protein ACKPB4_22350 [Sphaerospermopsis kisseleviana]